MYIFCSWFVKSTKRDIFDEKNANAKSHFPKQKIKGQSVNPAAIHSTLFLSSMFGVGSFAAIIFGMAVVAAASTQYVKLPL